MTRGAVVLVCVAAGLLLCAGLAATEPLARGTPRRNDYILACAGCHGLEGVSNSTLVPSLNGLVGYYLNLPEGRAYLSRVPNVAFSSMDDARLAAVLNYMVFEIGGASVPAHTKSYTAAEVGRWRKQPLTEVPLFEYRRRMVETLIDRYHAPAALRLYGEDFYGVSP